MSIALYRRYRSPRFDDLIGQDQIVTTLRNQVRVAKLAHAYLFTGIRGTGKTSTARILARAINCLKPDDGEPCNECASCTEILDGSAVDVLEIDAASNRGIDEIRDLREKVNYLPASLRCKVYIIDEAHMLTPPAWNAFLKTLEEPPSHVVFVLATTEPHQIPETIRSRAQRFDFRRVGTADISTHLQRIATSEAVEVDAGALSLIATAGQGSVRDAISLLDQALASGVRPLDTDAARRALGLADPATVRDLVTAISSRDAAGALRGAAAAFNAGVDARQLVRELARLVRGAALGAVGYPEGADLGPEDAAMCEQLGGRLSAEMWVSTLERLSTTERDLRQPVDARLQVEYCLLRLTRSGVPGAVAETGEIQALATRVERLETLLAERGTVAASPAGARPEPASPGAAFVPAPASIPAVAATEEIAATERAPEPVEHELETAVVGTSEPTLPRTEIATPKPAPPQTSGTSPASADVSGWTSVWAHLVEALNRRDSMLAGVLRDCRPLEAGPERLVVGAPYKFHLDRLNDPAKHAILVEAVGEIGGGPHAVDVQFCGSDKPVRAGKPSGGQSEATRVALDTFKGSRITSSRLRDASVDGGE